MRFRLERTMEEIQEAGELRAGALRIVDKIAEEVLK
jgi:hypothetical protein